MHLYLIVQIDYMQDVQELTFVLVKSLNLYIEDGVRVYFYAVCSRMYFARRSLFLNLMFMNSWSALSSSA